MSDTPLCACGCGQHVIIGVGGRPNTFVNGHNARMMDKSYMRSDSYRSKHRGSRNAQWKIDDDISYSRAHGRIDVAKGGKTGVCTSCHAADRSTEWAFLGPGGTYSVDPDDYVELCVRCHRRFDSRMRRCICGLVTNAGSMGSHVKKVGHRIV